MSIRINIPESEVVRATFNIRAWLCQRLGCQKKTKPFVLVLVRRRRELLQAKGKPA